MSSRIGSSLIRATVAVCLLTLPASAQEAVPPTDLLSQLSGSLKSLALRVAPTVVEIQVVAYGPDSDDGGNESLYKQHGTGSGVILDSDGYIITNAHVIKGAKRIRVTLNPAGGDPATILQNTGPKFDAALIGAHEDTDLAVLKIEATGLPTIALADYAELRQGQVVIAIGNPAGMKNTVSMGIVSSVARQISEDKPMVFIQTDAAISPGSSGGALVDTSGRLVGITSQAAMRDRLGFAVPSDIVKSVYNQIRKYGHVRRGDIGADVQTVTAVMAKALGIREPWGVIAVDVKPGSPAYKAGIRANDVILSIDARPVRALRDFEELLYFRTPGESLPVVVRRAGVDQPLKVAVADKASLPAAESLIGVDLDKDLIPRLGVFATSVTKELLENDPGIRDVSGVLVHGKAPDLQDVGCDLMLGDIIHAVNGRPIGNMDELRVSLQNVKAGDAIALYIERRHKFLYVAFESE